MKPSTSFKESVTGGSPHCVASTRSFAGSGARTLPASSPASSMSGRRWAAALGAILIPASIYLLSLESTIDAYRRLLALAVIWIGVLPTFIHLLDKRRSPIPFFPLLGLFYASNFGLPILIGNSRRYSDPNNIFQVDDVTPASLWMTLSGLSLMVVTYYIGRRLVWRKVKGMRISVDWGSGRLKLLLWICLVIYFVYRITPFLRAVPTLGNLLGPLVYLSFGVFFFLYKRGRLSSVESIILWLVILPAELLLRFSSGLIAEGMLLGLFFALISFDAFPKLAMGMIVLSFASLSILSPIKTQYRNLTWFSFNYESGIQLTYAKCELLVHLVYEHYFASPNAPDEPTSDKNMLAEVSSRMASVTVLSMVMNDTPDRVPYWNGQTYLSLFTKFIPRALWPDKPIEDTGNRFGHRYGILDDGDDVTSINLPWIVELYANFGAWGVCIGMTFFGLLLSALDQSLNRHGCNPVEIVVGAAVLLQIIYQDSSFALTIGTAFLAFLALRLVLILGLRPIRG